MEHTICCDNHLAAMCRRLEQPESAVVVRSLKNLPPQRQTKCRYTPCGGTAAWRLGFTPKA